MSFRRYGGLDRAATNNIVRSNYATGNNESITVALGQENSKIVCKSHLDLSGNSLINVGSIYFMEDAHLYGNITIDGSLTIVDDLIINGILNFNSGIITSTAPTFYFLPESSTRIEYGGNNTTNIIMGSEQSTAPDNGALVVTGGVGIEKNLNIGGTATFGNSIVLSGPTGSIIMNGPTGNYIQFPDQTKQYTAGVPPGTIVMWSGSSNDVPQYWTICNGPPTFNGSITGNLYTVPNLQNYFIIGAGDSYQLGNIGGNSQVTLLTGNLPAHSHSITGVTGSFVNSISFQSQGYDQGQVGQQESTQNFSYSTGTYTGPTSTNQSTGGGQAFEILPPYYSLYYIMFTP
jgi:microcystin-dependent protein